MKLLNFTEMQSAVLATEGAASRPGSRIQSVLSKQNLNR